MRYYLNPESGTVATLSDDEPVSSLPREIQWTPVRLHRGAGPMHREPSMVAKVIVSVLTIAFGLAVVAAVTGLAAWAWTGALS
jgi:hypothetical protein